MLELLKYVENDWLPPCIDDGERQNICLNNDKLLQETEECFVIFKTEPYIDAYYIRCGGEGSDNYMKRFTFHEGYRWSYRDERIFENKCLKNDRIRFDYGVLDDVFQYYSEQYPEWKLKRYFTKSMKLLDHIYHCMRRGSAKEMLYKAGLDELAVNIDMVDEINLLSSKPSDIYSGISMRTLRALNNKEGAKLLAGEHNRKFMKELQMKFPAIFQEELNDAQCKYLNFLIEGELTVGEVGRLFSARMLKLMCIWAPAQYDLFIWKETQMKAVMQDIEALSAIDPIYKEYIDGLDLDNKDTDENRLESLRFYLLHNREQYDLAFRRSNRRRNPDWQERDKGYVVRYPQTINDFCREAIYMSNCLMAYVDAYVGNDTTILLMRKADDYNAPFITIEIFENRLVQAYHRFNTDCTPEEAQWIRDYCTRHEIDRGNFKFDNNADELF